MSGPNPPSSPLPPELDLGMLEALRQVVRRARGVVVLTGAGVSAESGVPTFRNRDGIWSKYNPEELATPAAFRRDARKVWEWYDLRRRTIQRCAPNPGHLSLARLLIQREDVTVVTQNVDGLQQRAIEQMGEHAVEALGNRLLELHGSLFRARCSTCDSRVVHEDEVRAARSDTLPRCEPCGALLRPDVVWFGEALDGTTLHAAFQAAANAELCLVAGTSAVVHPAASIPLATLERGGDILEVNPDATPLTHRARWSLRGLSGRILPEILH